MIIRNDARSIIPFALKAERRVTEVALILEWSILYNAFISLLAKKWIYILLNVSHNLLSNEFVRNHTLGKQKRTISFNSV